MTANIILSTNLIRAQDYINANFSINNCISNCLHLNIPNNISLPNTIYLLNLDINIPINFNPNLNQKITVTDLRNSNSGWSLIITASPLIKNTDITKKISYQKIGVLSYANDAIKGYDSSVDDGLNDINAPLNKPVNFIQLSNNSVTTSEFSFFTGSNPLFSSSQTILSSGNNSRINSYTANLSLLINLEQQDINNLTDGTYTGYFDFTLST